jgi:hypothetical protein
MYQWNLRKVWGQTLLLCMLPVLLNATHELAV